MPDETAPATATETNTASKSAPGGESVRPLIVQAVLPRAVTVVGQPGSVVRPNRSGELAATVSAATAGAVIVVRDKEDVGAVDDLLMESGKRCTVIVQPGLGVRSLWRRQRTRQ